MSEINFTSPHPLRPNISTSEILSHAFENYKNTVLYAILAAIILFALHSILGSIVGSFFGYDDAVTEELIKDLMNGKKVNYDAVSTHPVHSILSMLVSVLLSPFYVGLLYITHKTNTQQEIQFSDLIIGYQQNTLQIMIFGFLSSLLATLGFMMCIFPGFIVMALMAIGLPIVFFENTTAVEAIQKSFKMTRPHFLVMLLTGIGSVLISTSGILLCFVGIVFTIMYMVSASYSAYCALCGTPKEIR